MNAPISFTGILLILLLNIRICCCFLCRAKYLLLSGSGFAYSFLAKVSLANIHPEVPPPNLLSFMHISQHSGTTVYSWESPSPLRLQNTFSILVEVIALKRQVFNSVNSGRKFSNFKSYQSYTEPHEDNSVCSNLYLNSTMIQTCCISKGELQPCSVYWIVRALPLATSFTLQLDAWVFRALHQWKGIACFIVLHRHWVFYIDKFEGLWQHCIK